MAVTVVDRLETVEVEEQKRQRTPAPGGALGFAPENQVQIAGVVQARQVVGNRQRFRLLQGQRVGEGEGRWLQHRTERQDDRCSERGGARRGRGVETDEHAHRAVAADQRKRQRGPGGAGRGA